MISIHVDVMISWIWSDMVDDSMMWRHITFRLADIRAFGWRHVHAHTLNEIIGGTLERKCLAKGKTEFNKNTNTDSDERYASSASSLSAAGDVGNS